MPRTEWVIVHVDHTPPDDQPWLISTRGELRDDAAVIAEAKKKWLSNLGPGKKATYKRVNDWIVKEQEAEWDNFDFAMRYAPQFSEHLGEMFMERCGPKTTVKFLVPAGKIKDILAACENDTASDGKIPKKKPEDKVVLTLPPRCRPKTWAQFWKVLLNVAPGVCGIDGMVEVATVSVEKDKPMKTFFQDVVVKQLIEVMGMRHCSGIRPAQDTLLYNAKIGETVGGHPNFVDERGASITPFVLVTRIERKDNGGATNGEISDNESDSDEGEKESRLLREQLVEACLKTAKDREQAGKNRCHFLIMDEKAGEEGVLWLPKFYKEEVGRIGAHVCGEGETIEIKRRLDKGNTDTGNLTIDIYNREFSCIKESRLRGLSVQDQLTAIIALLFRMRYNEYWMHDNEFPEYVAKLINEIATLLRTKLLRKTDSELNFEDDDGKTRAALYLTLEHFKKELLKVDSSFKLNYKPGKPKSEAWKAAQRESRKRKKETNETSARKNGRIY